MSSNDPATTTGASAAVLEEEVQRLRELLEDMRYRQAEDDKTIARLTKERDAYLQVLNSRYKSSLSEETLRSWATEEDEGISLSIEEVMQELAAQPGK